jgi:hypothetical protein
VLSQDARATIRTVGAGGHKHKGKGQCAKQYKRGEYKRVREEHAGFEFDM